MTQTAPAPTAPAAHQAPARADDLGRGLPDPHGLNLALGDTLADLPSVLRTFVLATVAVPIVIYGLMPRLHRLRARIIGARATSRQHGITTSLTTCGDDRSPHPFLASGPSDQPRSRKARP